MRGWRRVLCFGLLASAVVLLPSCGGGKDKIVVVCADALARSFEAVEFAYEAEHPGVEVIVDPQGSVLATRLVGFRASDVLAVADYRLIEKMLPRDHAAWVAKFAATDIVVASRP